MTASPHLPHAGLPRHQGQRPPLTCVSHRLCGRGGLPLREGALLDAFLTGKVRVSGARCDVAVEGAPADKVHFVLQGWGCRYRMLEDGRRQILALLLPGDVCCLSPYVPARRDQSLGTISRLTYAEVARAEIHALAQAHPALADAFGWSEAAARSAERQWTVNLGQRGACERLAHMICEVHHRLSAVGLAEDDGFAAPLSQTDLADVLGLSNVHVNRTLRDLRLAGMIEVRGRRVAIRDRAALARLATFDPTYLDLPDILGPAGPRARVSSDA